MADTLTTQTTVSTVPSGTVIATDDAGAAGHVQVVKLAVSTDGSATALTANNTDGLLVNLGSNNDVTVTGSVTANAGTNLNTSALALESGGNLADVKTAVQLIDDAVYTDGTGTPSKAIGIAGTDGTNPQIVKTDSSGELQVDVLSSALPSGAATAANQSTANTALSAIQTAVEILDNTVSGSEMQVDIVGSLPAGTNAIGKLAANSGVDIGDVDVASLPNTVHSADYDTGAGTDTTLAFGIAVPASGGAVVVPGDATAGLKVDLGADNDVTVTGTVTANLAAGTNNIGDVDILSIAAGDNNIGNVDIASIAAGDNNIGNVDIVTMPNVTNAGTFAVQESGAALTALQLIDDTVATDGSATPTKGILIAGQDGTNAQTVKTDSDGNLQVDVLSVTGTVTVDGSGVTQPVSHAALTELAAAIDTELQVDVVGALPAGTNAIGKLASNDGVDIGDVTINNATIAVTQSGAWDEVGINDSGNSITVDNAGTFVVQARPETSGGVSVFRSLDLDESEEDVKQSAGQIYGYYIANLATSIRYVKFYNATAANVTVGTTAAFMTLPIPAASSGGVAANLSLAYPIPFDTALAIAATTGLSDTDTGAPGADELIVNILYK